METTNLNECYIYFALTGNGFDPDKISTTLNLKATKIVREGSRIPGKIPVCSSWKYGTPLLRNGDVFRLGEIAEELIIPLLPLQEKITELIKIHNLSAIFMVVLTISTDEQDSTPALCFSPAVIEFCHSVGANIELDLYRS